MVETQWQMLCLCTQNDGVIFLKQASNLLLLRLQPLDFLWVGFSSFHTCKLGTQKCGTNSVRRGQSFCSVCACDGASKNELSQLLCQALHRLTIQHVSAQNFHLCRFIMNGVHPKCLLFACLKWFHHFSFPMADSQQNWCNWAMLEDPANKPICFLIIKGHGQILSTINWKFSHSCLSGNFSWKLSECENELKASMQTIWICQWLALEAIFSKIHFEETDNSIDCQILKMTLIASCDGHQTRTELAKIDCNCHKIAHKCVTQFFCTAWICDLIWLSQNCFSILLNHPIGATIWFFEWNVQMSKRWHECHNIHTCHWTGAHSGLLLRFESVDWANKTTGTTSALQC